MAPKEKSLAEKLRKARNQRAYRLRMRDDPEYRAKNARRVKVNKIY